LEKLRKLSIDRVDKLYDDKYCAKIAAKAWRRKFAKIIADTIDKHFKLNSIIDFGCSNGLHIEELRKLGYRTFGVEGSLEHKDYIKRNYKGKFAIIDLRMPFDIRKRFDISICIEVLEHISKDYSDIAVENICRHSGKYAFVTANPKNNARYHVNGQNKGYWIDRFKNNKFVYRRNESDSLESVFKRIPGPSIFIGTNLMVFRRDS
jgi:2-polyprenyl-3-methyl-5-hydroxy-6-metoxy-1,4-benzoquinol methylase